ncbi:MULTISPECIES: PopZ family protein [Kaistia]|uniref:DUF2497 domain-containing protein n=1 Tax=Kaistia nematophila TaxID=2994654 RepID=A0A9X3IK63_9HYPH|nr:DUF2497 domain-containing protein [Kaistia nematophila]MCX5568487.1 DUF2497 domain-containing protein [Kaistia nematophila]
MEEILASIRRIISEDELGLGASAAVVPKAPDPAPVPSTLPSVPVSAADIDALFSARVAEFAAPQPAPELRVDLPRIEPEPAQAPLSEPRMLRPVAPPSVSHVPARAPEPVRAAEPPRATLPVRPAASPVDELPAGAPLLSPAADAIVSSAFGSLASTVLAGNARTLEDLVKDMLRPMLKSWLDTNLPPLVERLVRDEIERVSRGR